MKRIRFRKPTIGVLIAVSIFAYGVYLAWPTLTFQDFPHVHVRAFLGGFVMVIASFILDLDEIWQRNKGKME